jgi:hypothetical protein
MMERTDGRADPAKQVITLQNICKESITAIIDCYVTYCYVDKYVSESYFLNTTHYQFNGYQKQDFTLQLSWVRWWVAFPRNKCQVNAAVYVK